MIKNMVVHSLYPRSFTTSMSYADDAGVLSIEQYVFRAWTGEALNSLNILP